MGFGRGYSLYPPHNPRQELPIHQCNSPTCVVKRAEQVTLEHFVVILGRNINDVSTIRPKRVMTKVGQFWNILVLRFGPELRRATNALAPFLDVLVSQFNFDSIRFQL